MKLRKLFGAQKSAERSGIGLALSKRVLAIASVKPSADGPVLEQCSILPLADEGDRQKVLAAAVDGMSLASRRSVCTLPVDDYRLTLLETPKADTESERNESLQLQMQNMSGFDLRDATFELFPLPDGGDQPSHFFIAAAEKTALSRVNDLVEGNGLELAAIDIVELGMRNLVARHDKAAEGVAVLALADSASRLWLYGGNNLYVARKLKASIAALNVDSSATDDGELSLLSTDAAGGEQELNGLLSQINRSFSYYQRNLGRKPISTLLVASESVALQGSRLSALISRLGAQLSAEVKPFDMRSGFSTIASFEPAYERAVDKTPSGSMALLTAIGAALRSLDSEQEG